MVATAFVQSIQHPGTCVNNLRRLQRSYSKTRCVRKYSAILLGMSLEVPMICHAFLIGEYGFVVSTIYCDIFISQPSRRNTTDTV